MAKKGETCRMLTFDHANAICRQFLPIGDEVYKYMQRLVDAGYRAFVPRIDFIESFATGPEELEIHRKCVIEEAKERLCRPEPMRMDDEQFKRIYRSPFLQRLREERDKANGVSLRELASRYSIKERAWRSEVDPCERNMIQFETIGGEAAVYKRSAMYDEEKRALEQEASLYATGLGKLPHTFTEAGRYDFFSAVMERDAVKLGFEYDKLKSRRNYPVFSKPLSEDWDLCWSIEDPRFFYESPMEGLLSPHLGLRSSKLRGSLSKAKIGEFLQFPYSVLIYGFPNGYWAFYDLDELERVINAHLFLYSLMAPAIEGGIKNVLEERAM